jgi:5-formaminoimidazole-4-carboxamide-1-(beta)-D-ribofuranosyl 5'-monophosphate synthetase
MIDKILESYDKSKITIGTIGSHSALNIFKGAKDEGIGTVCVCKKSDEIVYKRFPLADEIILVKDFREILDEKVQQRLRELNTILVPHGSFNAYLNLDEVTKGLQVPVFGNRQLLQWEVDREKQDAWLQKAGLRLPRTISSPEDIKELTLVKFPGAKGGKGYFLVSSPESFYKRSEDMILKGFLKKEDMARIHLQEYIMGVTIYPSYFRSVLRKQVELLCIDRRYESSIDSLGRIPAEEQLEMDNLSPTYTVVGNIPITLRESLLSEYIRMGDSVVNVSEEIAPPGIVGPFCLETIATDTPEIVTFEISARIVAGTNVGIGTSPYSYLMYGEGVYMGRRIAMEVKKAVEEGKISEIVT